MAWKEFEYSCLSKDTSLDYRPYLQVILRAEKELSLYAIVDSGCETTMVNIEVAPLLGIKLGNCKRILVSGVGKGERKGYETTLEIEIPECGSFVSPVIFSDFPAEMLLGQNSFFRNFHVLFEGNLGKFKLNKVTRLRGAQ